MAQPGDLARVGDDHVGVDDGRVVLGVSTGMGGTSTYYLVFCVWRFGHIRFPYSQSQNTRGKLEWKCAIFAKFLSSEVRNRNSTCCRG